MHFLDSVFNANKMFTFTSQNKTKSIVTYKKWLYNYSANLKLITDGNQDFWSL